MMSRESRGSKVEKKKRDRAGRGGDIDRKVIRAKQLRGQGLTINKINEMLRIEFGSGLGRRAEDAMRDAGWKPGKFHLRDSPKAIPSFKEEAKRQVRAGKQKQFGKLSDVGMADHPLSYYIKQQREDNKEIAKKLLDKGVPPVDVMKRLGMTIDEIGKVAVCPIDEPKPDKSNKHKNIKLALNWKDGEKVKKFKIGKIHPNANGEYGKIYYANSSRPGERERDEYVVEWMTPPIGRGFYDIKREKFTSGKDAIKWLSKHAKVRQRDLTIDYTGNLIGTEIKRDEGESFSFPSPSEDAPGFEMEFDSSMLPKEEKQGWI